LQLTARTCEAFNPYPYMGGPAYADPSMPQSWPRGFPLQLIKKPCNVTLVPGDTSKVAVLQSLADHDPDVDGIYRLTRGVPFNLNPNSDSTVVLPRGVLAPWNAHVGQQQRSCCTAAVHASLLPQQRWFKRIRNTAFGPFWHGLDHSGMCSCTAVGLSIMCTQCISSQIVPDSRCCGPQPALRGSAVAVLAQIGHLNSRCPATAS
jgi:hypothetical protein